MNHLWSELCVYVWKFIEVDEKMNELLKESRVEAKELCKQVEVKPIHCIWSVLCDYSKRGSAWNLLMSRMSWMRNER